MAKAFLEAKQLSSALPHCPLEHSSETLHEVAPITVNVRRNRPQSQDTTERGNDLEA